MDVLNLATETQTLPDSFAMALITIIYKGQSAPPIGQLASLMQTLRSFQRP